MKIKKILSGRRGVGWGGGGVRWSRAVLLNPPMICNTVAMRSVDSD